MFGRDRCLKVVGHNIIRVQAGRANLEVDGCTIVYVLSIPIERYGLLCLIKLIVFKGLKVCGINLYCIGVPMCWSNYNKKGENV